MPDDEPGVPLCQVSAEVLDGFEVEPGSRVGRLGEVVVVRARSVVVWVEAEERDHKVHVGALFRKTVLRGRKSCFRSYGLPERC